MNKLSGVIIFLFVVFCAAPQLNPAFASFTAGCPSGAGIGVNTVWTLDCVFPLVANFVSLALTLAGIVAMFLIIYSGIKFMLSSGDPKQLEGARNTLIYAILGLLLVFFSFGIVLFISNLTGVACLNPMKSLSFTTCGS
jgi:hypothetical protein